VGREVGNDLGGRVGADLPRRETARVEAQRRDGEALAGRRVEAHVLGRRVDRQRAAFDRGRLVTRGSVTALVGGARGKGQGAGSEDRGSDKQAAGPFADHGFVTFCRGVRRAVLGAARRRASRGPSRSATRLAITMRAALNSVVPTMIGRSTVPVAPMSSRPMPGRPKTRSVMTVPPSRAPTSSAVSVMTGRARLRRAYPSIRRSPRPAAREVRA